MYVREKSRLFFYLAVLLAAVLLVSLLLWWHRINAQPDTPAQSAARACKYMADACTFLSDPDAVVCAAQDAPIAGRRAGSFAPGMLLNDKEKLSLLAQNSKALEAVRGAIRERFYCSPADALRPTIDENALALGMLLVLKGRVEAGRREWSKATDAYLDALDYGSLISHGGNFTIAESGRQIQSVARLHILQVLPHLTASEVRAATRKMEVANRMSVPFSAHLHDVETTIVVDYLETFRGRNLIQALRTYDDTHILASDNLRRRLRVLKYSKKGIIQDLSRYMEEHIRRTRRPYALRPPQLPQEPMDPFFLGPANDYVSYQWCNAVLSETLNCQLLVALGIRAFQLENGRLPSSLSELVPEQISKLPDDPFSRMCAFGYRKKGGSYKIYSVGPDGLDNGGQSQGSLSMMDGRAVEPGIRGDVVFDAGNTKLN